jgi:hypothetical protein
MPNTNTLTIYKEAGNVWRHRHNGNALTDFSISDFTVSLDTTPEGIFFNIVQNDGARRYKYKINNITVIDNTNGGASTSYTTILDFVTGMTVLGYTPYIPKDAAESITGLIVQGTNITITGSGTSGSPYVINSSGGDTPNLQQVLMSGGREVVQIANGDSIWETDQKSKTLVLTGESSVGVGIPMELIYATPTTPFDPGDLLEVFNNTGTPCRIAEFIDSQFWINGEWVSEITIPAGWKLKALCVPEVAPRFDMTFEISNINLATETYVNDAIAAAIAAHVASLHP